MSPAQIDGDEALVDLWGGLKRAIKCQNKTLLTKDEMLISMSEIPTQTGWQQFVGVIISTEHTT